jgi:DNA-binding IclR family transcriptional regulator
MAKGRRKRANAAAQARILDALKKRGGKIEAGSVRKIAELIGARRSTAHSALAVLLAAGAVAKAGRTLLLA